MSSISICDECGVHFEYDPTDLCQSQHTCPSCMENERQDRFDADKQLADYPDDVLVTDEEYRNLQAVAHTAKNVWMWYSCVAEGGRVDEIESLGLALQRWESDND
jgi:hypothetical protein